ncbi:MAG: helix-turn-helix transcriptional regulator [Bacteroidales bacterium]|nr:helix-turn-helix transcriptional regulator [Bacteroidales bacterium]
MNIRFAIIDSNILLCLGLQQLLSELMPMAEIIVCKNLEELQAQENPCFLHYFVSSQKYFEHASFFREHPHKSIVLVSGEMLINDVYTLNICQSEQALVRDIMRLQHRGHQGHHDRGAIMMQKEETGKTPLLSAREAEVAVLLCKGFINKEIADRLNVSTTTIISHRKNIMEKLNARSLADIIIHCVMNGYVRVEEM